MLLGAVCALIPILGPIVYLGYLTEVIVAQHRHGEESFAAFDFDYFGRYLSRGLWPFLVQLVAGLIVVPHSDLYTLGSQSIRYRFHLVKPLLNSA